MNKRYDYNDKFSFIVDFFDYELGYHIALQFNYYPCDNTVEMYMLGSHDQYLRRSLIENVTSDDIFIGNTIRVFGKLFHLRDYYDIKTKNSLCIEKQTTLAIIKPGAINKMKDILARIENEDLKVVKLRMAEITRKEALLFYEKRKGENLLPFMVEHLVSGPLVAVLLVGNNAIARWREIMGPTNPIDARKDAPNSLRALYGEETASNAVHGSSTDEEALFESKFFFPDAGSLRNPPLNTLVLNNCTCCIIKPHALKEGKMSAIITEILRNKFKINHMLMIYLTDPNAAELLEVYHGIIPNFQALMFSFTEGPCMAMEIGSPEADADVHGEFRKLCGPQDSHLARQIRPYTLRALFGRDKYRNAVHCTDLKEDCELELEYMFRILDDWKA